MLSIHTNNSYFSVQNQYRQQSEQIQKYSKQLSAGKKLVDASDDSSGVAISVRMQSQSRGMSAAERNIMDGISLIETMDGHLESFIDRLQRQRELLLQADNGTYNHLDIEAMNAEYKAITEEFSRNYWDAPRTFNNQNLVNGTSFRIHVSDKYNDALDIQTELMDPTAIGGTPVFLGDIAEIGSVDHQTAIQGIDASIEHLLSYRSYLGGRKNHFDMVIENLHSRQENIEATKERVEGGDMAMLISDMAKEQLKNKSSILMLQKTGEQMNSILTLFQN